MLSSFLAGVLFQWDVTYEAFKFDETKPIIVGIVIIFSFMFTPCGYVFALLENILSRSIELDADAFAVRLGLGRYLRSALIKLDQGNSVFPVWDRLFSMFKLNHPSLLERLERLPR